jgi:hypothetical protein
MKNFFTDAVIIILMVIAVGCAESWVPNPHHSVIVQLMITFIGAYMLGYLAKGRRKES